METNISDIEILQRIKGDQRFFSLFYEKYYKPILKYCYLRLNFSKELAEDCTSDIFIKALTHIGKVKLDEDHPSILPWLYKIASNELKQRYRKASKQRTTPLSIDMENFIPSQEQNEDKRIDEINDSERILDAIRKLDTKTQEIITLKINEELSFAAIAQIVSMKESAVKMKYYRGLEIVTKTVNS